MLLFMGISDFIQRINLKTKNVYPGYTVPFKTFVKGADGTVWSGYALLVLTISIL